MAVKAKFGLEITELANVSVNTVHRSLQRGKLRIKVP